MLVNPNWSFTISVSAAAMKVSQPRLSRSFLSVLPPGFSVFGFVFPAWVTSNAIAFSVTPSFHLYWGFPTLLLLRIVGCRAFFDIVFVHSDYLPFQLNILILHSMCQSSCPIVFALTTIILCSSPWSEVCHVSKQYFFFYSGYQPHAQLPTWRARVTLFVWVTCLAWETPPVAMLLQA